MVIWERGSENINVQSAASLCGRDRHSLGQVFFGLVEPRVRVGVVQDHQR